MERAWVFRQIQRSAGPARQKRKSAPPGHNCAYPDRMAYDAKQCYAPSAMAAHLTEWRPTNAYVICDCPPVKTVTESPACGVMHSMAALPS